MRNTLVLLTQVIIAITIGETFRIPMLSILIIISFFLSGNDAVSNTSTVLMAGTTIIAGTLLTIVFLMLSLSEPGLRLPCMLMLTLCAGFMSQAATLGPLFNILFFWIVYMAMNADILDAVGYSLDGFVGNTTDSIVPDAAFLPPEESMLHLLLWICFVFLIGITLLVVTNKLAGHDPLVALRNGLVARLNALADFCEAQNIPNAVRPLHRFAQQGGVGLRRAHDLASRLHPDLLERRAGIAMIRTITRLVLITVYLQPLLEERDDAFMRAVGRKARLCAAALENRRRDLQGLEADDIDLSAIARETMHTDPLRFPLGTELARALTIIRSLILVPDTEKLGFVPEAPAPARTYLKPDAFKNPAYAQAAVRIALCVAICYVITRATSWPGIQTCVVTCFLVSLETVGDTVHKMLLRIIGALVGASFGIGTILLLMPYMTDCTELLLAVVPVTLLAGWIKSGSDRIAYAGVQIALAYFMTVLQGYGPTLDMETGRDRVVGILIGNIVVYLVSVSLWPVSVTATARRHLVNATRLLGSLLIYRRKDPESLLETGQEIERENFGKAIAAVRSSIANAPLEVFRFGDPHEVREIDERMITAIQMLAVPIALLADINPPADDIVRTHEEKLKNWFDEFALWVSDGENGRDLLRDLPQPPDLPSDPQREIWFRVLDQHLRLILGDLVPGLASQTSMPTLNIHKARA
ncbi:hypothetical protein A0U93_00565 [Neoasaia chiangmaiensis]|uniref:Integral membrane bound transporter domain-containing protein n=1 Tax=Neoasaia chiangmaiensis TaxID=320497 RepID=A0A1U9KLM3_9PROT|nr:hypothetical protein A0U93_00565 [Neoasaia chiangmaiensis]